MVNDPLNLLLDGSHPILDSSAGNSSSNGGETGTKTQLRLAADSEARMTSEMVATKLVLRIEDLDRVVNTAIRVSIGVCEL
ncbi:hypothetical protein LINGRAHAP2_LOCUS7752 [Linum grandiflorum]